MAKSDRVEVAYRELAAKRRERSRVEARLLRARAEVLEAELAHGEARDAECAAHSAVDAAVLEMHREMMRAQGVACACHACGASAPAAQPEAN